MAADTKYNEHLHPGTDEVYFVPETGELVFGDDVYDSIRAGKDLSVDYKKTEFAAKDVRPEHYLTVRQWIIQPERYRITAQQVLRI